MTVTAVSADQWCRTFQFCNDKITPTSNSQARYVLELHGKHGNCPQYSTADDYYRGDSDDDV